MADAPNDFAALARQYMDLWGDALRGVSAPAAAAPGVPGMGEAFDAWMRQVGGQAPVATPLAHFQRQSRDWYAQMQQVAAQFAGRDHSASDVAAAWRDAFGGGHPFSGLLDGMRGPGLESVAQWMEASAPSLHGLRAETAAALRMPAFGFTREHQERLQALALAQLRWQDAQQAYSALMAKVSGDAVARFQARLAECEQAGRQLDSARALFDLWVDAAEDAWAEAALSEEYRHAFGELVNAQMRQRAAAQALGEQAAAMYGWPTRGELDGAHRKIAELERQLRRMQRDHRDTARPRPATQAERAKPAVTPVDTAAKASAASPQGRKARAPEPAMPKKAASPPPAASTRAKTPAKTPAGQPGPARRKR